MEPLIDLPAGEPLSSLPSNLPSRELQQLWFSLLARPWSSLLVVPAPGVESALAFARGLVHVSRRSNPGSRLSVIDATRASLEQVASLHQQLAAVASQRHRALAVVDPVDVSPAAFALAPRCDGALLCVLRGRTSVAAARSTLEQCGRSRFLGAVVLVPGGSAAGAGERSCTAGER